MNTSLGAVRVKKYAAGGLVEPASKSVSPWSLKGIYNTAKGALAKSPEQEEKDAALADYKARAQAERNPAQQPAPTPGISAYVSNTALQAREKAAGLKAGGAIRGKGTGTSDEVPIMASNGEFVIKAKAVKAIGTEVLEALNTIADKPDEKDSKAEAMREYGEGSESATHETAEDAIEGMKCGGKVKKMATGGLIDETDSSKTGYGPYTTEGMAARQAAHQAQLDSANTLAANNAGKGALPVAPVAAPAPVDPVAAHNASLASAQALATARASGANPTVESEAAGRAAYGNALEASKTAGSPAYFTQQTPTSQQNATNTAQAATGALRNVYGTPAPVAAPVAVDPMVKHNAALASAQALAANNLNRGALPAPQGTPAAAAQPAAPVQKPAGALPASQPSAPAPTTAPVPGGDIPTAPVQSQPGVVTSADRLQSDAAINSVMGRRGSADQDLAARVERLKAGTATADDWTTPNGGGVIATSNADANIKKIAGSATGRDTVNAAWAQRGAGIQATSDGKGGLTLSNADGPQKMQYTDASGKPTNDYRSTQQYAEGMVERDKLLAAAAKNPSQYEQEVAQAQAINRDNLAVTEAISNRESDARARLGAELKLSSIFARKEEKEAAQRTLDALNQKANAAAGNAASMDRTMVGDATTRREQDIRAAGQAVQAGALRRTQQIAQDKFGIERSQEARAAAKDGLDAKQKARLDDAYEAFNKSPTEENAKRVRGLMGNDKADQYAHSPGGQIVVDGQLVTQPGFVYNKQTGQQVQQGKPSVPDAATARTQALVALKANPANKDEINKRLAAAGYQPI